MSIKTEQMNNFPYEPEDKMIIKDMPHDEKLKLFNNHMKMAYPDGHKLGEDYISLAELTIFENNDICLECTINEKTCYRVTSGVQITHPDFYKFKKKILKKDCECEKRKSE